MGYRHGSGVRTDALASIGQRQELRYDERITQDDYACLLDCAALAALAGIAGKRLNRASVRLSCLHRDGASRNTAAPALAITVSCSVATAAMATILLHRSDVCSAVHVGH